MSNLNTYVFRNRTCLDSKHLTKVIAFKCSKSVTGSQRIHAFSVTGSEHLHAFSFRTCLSTVCLVSKQYV